MSIEENKDLIRRYYKAVDEKRDGSIIDDFVAPDYVDHNPTPGFSPDREGLKGSFQHFLAAAPDGYHVIEDLIAEGDRVVARVRAYGTQTGELFGIAPTGRRIETVGIAIRRIANGKIVEHWNIVDMMSVMQQLGLLAPPAKSTR